MSKVYIAFYKHKRKRKGLKNIVFRLCDDTIRFLTKGDYSHCEMVIPNYEKNGKMLFECYTASNIDGDVRLRLMSLPSDRWDLVEVDIDADLIRLFYKQTAGLKYDWLGALGVILPFKQNAKKYFCSEWCAECLGFDNPHKFSPNSLYRKLKNEDAYAIQ